MLYVCGQTSARPSSPERSRADEAGRAAARQHDHGNRGRQPRRPRRDRRPQWPARLGASLAELVLLRTVTTPASSSSSAATAAIAGLTMPRTATCSGASRPVPARTATATPFMLDGKEVLPSTRGQCARGTAHGDNLWLFGSMARSDLSRPARHRPPQSRTRQSQGRLDRRSERRRVLLQALVASRKLVHCSHCSCGFSWSP